MLVLRLQFVVQDRKAPVERGGLVLCETVGDAQQLAAYPQRTLLQPNLDRAGRCFVDQLVVRDQARLRACFQIAAGRVVRIPLLRPDSPSPSDQGFKVGSQLLQPGRRMTSRRARYPCALRVFLANALIPFLQRIDTTPKAPATPGLAKYSGNANPSSLLTSPHHPDSVCLDECASPQQDSQGQAETTLGRLGLYLRAISNLRFPATFAHLVDIMAKAGAG